MKALKTIVIIILFIVALFFIIPLFLPAKVHFERSLAMKCPAPELFNQVNNFRNWHDWSPFEHMDTTMAITYEGPEEGVNAVMKWTSKTNGNGKMTLIESIPSTYIKAALDFMNKEQAQTEWKFQTSDTGTMVTWSLDMMNLAYPMGRYFALAMPAMMNKTYDQGLANLKKLCETLPNIEGLEIKTIEAQPVLYIKDSALVNDIGAKMQTNYSRLMTYIAENKIRIAGPPYSAWYSWDASKPMVFDAGIPVAGPVKGTGNIMAGEIKAGKVICAPSYGSYEKTGNLYMALEKYLDLKKMSYIGAPWEVYYTDPGTEPDTSKWLTYVFFRIQ
jgi:effector-binding domain-containing protein